ncbi:type I DNA topoisomerase [Lachnoclostridium sp. Marseille-P6806]|uniref:type I DNA topoisomerase n=1 Tax=Lachnoclostridium sp. Marseille-P6806 TaxID=2364793 RepID=UPI0010313613|nr:type I DNA topoisomerase [Lachnoclostridium sp. Marseille-P6806]
MAKNLIIVESPAKSKTIKKFLGAGYEVVASQGHVRDLPKSQMGIDVAHDYEPKYITIRGKGELLAALRREVKKADKIYLATDPDREGEAISWHLLSALGLDGKSAGKKVSRITFNEITKNAVREAIRHPRDIDMNLVDAQQARRVMDRMVGYRISPLLWAKVKRGLSAGRVQSVALRMIGDREEEIGSFIPQEYWSLDAVFGVKGEKKSITAHYYGAADAGTGHRQDIPDRAAAEAIQSELAGASFRVSEIRKSERTTKAPLPFTTSTLQQEASKTLNFSTQKTMRIAQQLYEGVDIKGQGTVGLITYLRTDSVRISEEAGTAAADYIGSVYGKEYMEALQAVKKNGPVRSQDAHEAIRPTDILRTPDSVRADLGRDQLRLYQLIWKRFTASRMSAAKYETTQVRIEGKGKKRSHIFTLSASRVVFDGFMRVYTNDEEKGLNAGTAKGIDENSVLTLQEFLPEQHFTQPQPHYTEASLVRALEEQGIGRPSTYAPTITTILGRRYVVKEDKNLYMTELGEIVNNMMKEAFPQIVDPRFTANLESLLDGVADGEVKWKTIIENFYPDLDEAVNKAEQELDQVRIADEESDEICEKCGRRMVIKYGPHGKFLACPGFPECRNTRPYFEKIGVACPQCGRDIVIKKTRKGRKYYGCLGNPECDFMVWQKPSKKRCPVCGGLMLEKGQKLVCSNEECGHMEERQQEENGR